MQHSGSTDGEAENGSQRGNQQKIAAETKDVGEDGGDGKDESQNIEPEGRADRSVQIFIPVSAQAQLQQESRQPNGSDDDQRERTEEGGTASVDDYQSEGGE